MRNILVIVFMLILKTGIAQLDFKIENIIVSKVIEELYEDIIHEDFGEGPCISVDCSIINKSSDTIILYPSTCELEITFTFENIQYSKSPVYLSLLFLEIDSLTILPNQRYDIHFYDMYLLGAEFYKWSKISLVDIKRISHIKEVIATLPTLRVRYKDKNTDIITNWIENVSIGDIPYIYK